MRRSALVLGTILLLASGCGDDEAGYSASVKASFVEACAAGVGDQGDAICGCAFDRIADEIPFEQFEELDDEVRQDPDADLPRRITRIVESCAEPDDTTTTTED